MSNDTRALILEALGAYFNQLLENCDPTPEMVSKATMLDALMHKVEAGDIELGAFAVSEPILQQPVEKCFREFGFSSKHAMYRAIRSGKWHFYEKRGGRILVNVEQARLAVSIIRYPNAILQAYADSVKPERELAAEIQRIVGKYFEETKDRDEKGFISISRPEGY